MTKYALRLRPALPLGHTLGLPVPTCAACAASIPASRRFSVLNRPPPNYPGHVPLTTIERAGLAVGSGIMSFFDPYRHGKSMLHSCGWAVR